MKRTLSKLGLHRIVLAVFCLLTTNQYAFSKSDTDTTKTAQSLSYIIPRAVQELQICDLVKQENSVLNKYNGQLKTEATTQAVRAEKYKGKAQSRGRFIAGHIVLDCLIIALIFL